LQINNSNEDYYNNFFTPNENIELRARYISEEDSILLFLKFANGIFFKKKMVKICSEE